MSVHHDEPNAADNMIELHDKEAGTGGDKPKEDHQPTGTGESQNQTDDPKTNEFSAARGRIQRYVDLALLMSNMSMIATIVKRQYMFSSGQYLALIATLTIAMIAEILAGILFFIAHERDVAGKKNHRCLDIVAYSCVGIVMLLNLFSSTFSASWTEVVPSPTLTPASPPLLTLNNSQN